MARTELPNGVILPAEYSDDWYEDMTSNLTKLDDVIGSDSEKLNADGVYFLRMSSAALTDSGTGNFSDLNSSYKIKTGDLVLDSGRKLYRIVSVDSTNETFTVGNSLFKVTAESDLAPVAESGDYGDLDNRPDLNPYDQHLANTDIHVTAADKQKWNNGVSQAYVVRYANVAVSDNSTVPFSNLNNVDNIKANDLLLDTNGKMYQISAVDTSNETVSVTTPLTRLAVDSSVIHNTGNETKNGELTLSKLNTNSIQSATGNIQIQSTGTNRSVSMFNGPSAGDGGGFWAYGKDSVNGSDCRLQIYNTSKSRYERVDLVNSQWLPTPSGELDCGGTSNKWKTFNGLEPSSLGMPDLSNGLDISGYITVNGGNKESLYTPPTNGWISVRLSRTSGDLGVLLIQGGMASSGRDVSVETGGKTADAMLPVVGGVQVSINSALADNVVSAYFFPCLGNV